MLRLGQSELVDCVNYRVSQKRRLFLKIKNITDLQNDDKEGKIKENLEF